MTLSEPNNENVLKHLKPDKLFKDKHQDIKVGDQIELCPPATNMTQELCSLLEISRGISLIVDYGEDHAFSNSFRVTSCYLNYFTGMQRAQDSERI